MTSMNSDDGDGDDVIAGRNDKVMFQFLSFFCSRLTRA
jgi:hypothetical protein